MKPELPTAVAREFDLRLTRGAQAPLALAFSGGGDSLALLLMARIWAETAGRRLIAITVDHELQFSSDAWTAWCAGRADRLGVAHVARRWQGPKPANGLPAAARLARHRLVAEVAREAGARVILFGHTADDTLEGQAMRAGGVRVSDPRAWAPSPVWPEGRGLFLLRPLLTMRRAELRAWLAERGETWIEDPANDDLRHPRARARARVTADGPPALPTCEQGRPAPVADFGPAGEIRLGAGEAERPSALGAAILCAAGGERPPGRGQLEPLARRLAGDAVSATLSGARVVKSLDTILVVRETGDRRGRPCASLSLPPGRPVVWDGRFEALTREVGLILAPLAGRASALGQLDRRRLREVHPAVRPGLPALVDAHGAVSCPTLTADHRLALRRLGPARWAGATGAVADESELAAVTALSSDQMRGSPP